MKIWGCIILIVTALLLPAEAWAAQDMESSVHSQLEEQLDAVGRDELMAQVPEATRKLMESEELYDMSFKSLIGMTPGRFFSTLWRIFLDGLKKPIRALGTMLGIVLLCSLLESLRAGSFQEALSGVFQTISVLCILTSIAMPVLDCIMKVSATIKNVALFMLSFIPIFSAAMVSAGQPISGSTYSIFLMGVCQLVAQVISQTLIPLMSVYLAISICGSFVPDLKVVSAVGGIKTAINWAMGFMLTVFVALLSIQSILSYSADGVTVKATKFLIASLVPVAGSVLSDAFTAAYGCLRLVKTTIGVYGIIVVLLTFLPILLQVTIWMAITRVIAVASDVMGITRVSDILRSSANVLGMLISVVLCFGLLVVVSTGVVMAIGTGGG